MAMTKEQALALAQARRRRAEAPSQLGPVTTAAAAVGEPILKLATGALGKIAGDISGLASGTFDVLTGGKYGGRGAQDVQQDVQQAMTYQPRTELGKSESNPLNAIPQAIGEGFGAIGNTGADFVGSNIPGDQTDPTSPAGVGANFTREALPQVLGILGAKYAGPATTRVGHSMQRGGEKLMRSALRPTPTQIASGDANIAARSLLERGLNPTEFGVNALKGEISSLDDQISAAVRQSNETMPVSEVLRKLEKPQQQFSMQADPMADVAAIRNLKERFEAHPKILMDSIPMGLAHDMKRGTYKTIGESYGRLGSAEIEGQKALASGLREGVASRVPGVRELSAQEASLMRGLDVVERRAFSDLTRNPVDLGLYVHNRAARAAFLANKSTMFKSLFARLLNATGQGAEAVGKSITLGAQ